MRTILSSILVTMLLASLANAQSVANAALTKRLPTISLKDVALTDAIEFFRDATNANLTVDWRSLEEVGISKDTPVSLSLRHVPTRVALKAVLESAAPGLLTFTVSENVITITTIAKADGKMITRIYPVQDLLTEIPDFEGPSLSLTDQVGNKSGNSDRGGRNGGSNQSGGIFGTGGNSNASNRDEEKTKTRTERADDLIAVIQETIRPEIWDTNGGKARIRFFNGNLIVTAPKSVHEAIGGSVD